MLNQSKQILEDASEESAFGQNQVQVFIHKLPTPLDVLESAKNRNENDYIGNGDGQQKERGNGSPDNSANGFKGIETVLNRLLKNPFMV